MEFLSPPVARLVELGTVCPSVLPIGACGLDPFISLSAQGLGSEEPFSMRVMWVVQWLRRTVRSIGVVSPPSRLRRRCETSLVFKLTGCGGNFVCSPAWALPLPVSEGYISLYKGGLTRQFFIRLVPTSPVRLLPDSPTGSPAPKSLGPGSRPPAYLRGAGKSRKLKVTNATKYSYGTLDERRVLFYLSLAHTRHKSIAELIDPRSLNA
jgi:hypothetical protein